jgi:hypothetical protein
MKAQPQPVVRRIAGRDGKRIAAEREPRQIGGTLAEDDHLALAAPAGRRDKPGRRIVNAEVAAHHLDPGIPARQGQRGRIGTVAQHQPPGKMQVEAILDRLDSQGHRRGFTPDLRLVWPRCHSRKLSV